MYETTQGVVAHTYDPALGRWGKRIQLRASLNYVCKADILKSEWLRIISLTFGNTCFWHITKFLKWLNTEIHWKILWGHVLQSLKHQEFIFLPLTNSCGIMADCNVMKNHIFIYKGFFNFAGAAKKTNQSQMESFTMAASPTLFVEILKTVWGSSLLTAS